MRLYHMPPEKISIVIHRESIVHSLVEYCDHAVLAQLGVPDMRLPIQYALTWPGRVAAVAEPLDLLSCPPLTFHAPDYVAFPCLALALEAAHTGGSATAVLNGANEEAVGQFLAGQLSFFPALRSRWPTPWPRFPRCSLPLPGGHSGRGSGGAGGRAGTPARYALSKERCYDHPVHPDYHPALRRAHRHP